MQIKRLYRRGVSEWGNQAFLQTCVEMGTQ